MKTEMTKAAWTISPADVVRLRQHPAFPAAMRLAAQSAVDLHRNDRLLNGLLSERARALFTYVALYLHFAGGKAGEAGLTVGAMKDMCVKIRLCSRGRCEVMLAVMRAAGLLTAAPHDDDRRRRPLLPTEKLLMLHKERLAPHFDAMSKLMPEAASYRAALADPMFIRALTIGFGWRYISGWRILDRVPELWTFAERNAGMVILFSLALAGPSAGPFPPLMAVPLSINALASKFSVSRKHVLTLLRDAEAEELLTRGGASNNEIILLPRGRAALEGFVAAMFLYQAACAEDAFQDAFKASRASAS